MAKTTEGQQQGAVEKTLRILIVGADPSLEDEFRTALSGMPDVRGVIYFAERSRDALEVASGRQPNFVLLEIDRDAGEVAALAKTLHDVVPAAPMVGAFRPDRLEHGQSDGVSIIHLVRAHVGDFLRRPLSATELRTVFDRLFARAPGTETVEQGRVVTLVSNRGGVGKSTLSVNIACGLALKHPEEVLLLDTSLQGGTCAWLLDV